MDRKDNQRRIAEYAMMALKNAIDGVPNNGALLTTLFTERSGATQRERVDMASPEESLSAAQRLVMEDAPAIDRYAIAYVAFLDVRTPNDFTATPALDWRSAAARGQPALLVEAGDRHEELGLLTGVKLLRDAQGAYLESRASLFTGTPNFLAGALKLAR